MKEMVRFSVHVEEEERGREGRVGEGDRKNEMKIKHCMSGKGQTLGEETGKAGEKGRIEENKKEKTFSGTLDSWLDKEGGC